MAMVVGVRGAFHELWGPQQVAGRWVPAIRDGLGFIGAADIDLADVGLAFDDDLFHRGRRSPGDRCGDHTMTLATFKDLCLDAVDVELVGRFWAAALGRPLHRRDDGIARIDHDILHTLWINPVPEPKLVKNRVHLDVHAPSAQLLIDLGATPGVAQEIVPGGLRSGGRRAVRLPRRRATDRSTVRPVRRRRVTGADRGVVGRSARRRARRRVLMARCDTCMVRPAWTV